MATVKRATLFDPKTGNRVAVDVDSQQSRQFFGQGYQLETPTNNFQTVKSAPTPTATTPTQQPLPVQPGERQALINTYVSSGVPIEEATARVNELWAGRPEQGGEAPRSLLFNPTGQTVSTSAPKPQMSPADSYQAAIAELLRRGQGGGGDADLYEQRNKLVQARFNAVGNMTPEELQKLSPAQQAAIRSGDVRGLEEQLGGVNTALETRAGQRAEARGLIESTAKQFEQQKRNTSLEKINGKDVLIDKDTGEILVDYSAMPGAQPDEELTQGAYNALLDLEKLPGFSSAVGAKGLSSFFGLKEEPIQGTPAADFNTKLKQFQSFMSLSFIPYLKGTGAISNKEQEILANAASSLSTKMSETQFKEEVGKMKQILIKSGASPQGYISGQQSNGGVDELDKVLDSLGFKNDLSTSKNGFLSPIARSIIEQESGGNYKAVGQQTRYGKALGKYQIMPNFHFAKIGLKDTPADHQKFLNSPQLQDKLFGMIIDDLGKRYNNDPRKIAAAYYGGADGASIVGTPAADKKQTAGGKEFPSINEYVNSVVTRAKRYG